MTKKMKNENFIYDAKQNQKVFEIVKSLFKALSPIPSL
jgi:hypothetical protein